MNINILITLGIVFLVAAIAIELRNYFVTNKYKNVSSQLLNMACDYMFCEGCLEARRQQGAFPGTKARRRLAYDRAAKYAKDFPCDAAKYLDQLASNFIEGYIEEQEGLQRSTSSGQRETTARQRVPMDGTQFYAVADERETA